MTRGLVWTLHLANLLVAGTGLVYAVLCYAVAPSDPYSVVNHPWQPTAQHLHVLAAPLLVFATGAMWHAHAWSQFRKGVLVRRRSGITLLVSLAPMVASGYLLQTAVDPTWRKAWIAIHLGTSALWVLGYLAHWMTPRRTREGTHGRD